MTGAEWTDIERVRVWPSFRRDLPHAADAEAMLIEHLIDAPIRRVLDPGTGDGHLVALLLEQFPDAKVVGLDLSPSMVKAAQTRFQQFHTASFQEGDLMRPLSHELGRFDLIVSALAIHHLPDERKRKPFKLRAFQRSGLRLLTQRRASQPQPKRLWFPVPCRGSLRSARASRR